MAEVIPAILEKSADEIKAKIKRVESMVSWVQIDIADGKLVENNNLFLPSEFTAFETKASLELHMMVQNPVDFLNDFAPVDFKRFYAHIEADGIEDYIAGCFRLGVECGLAIDGPTPVEKIMQYLDNIDCVLVMAIKAGFSGQSYLPETAEKIKKIRSVDFDIPICVDGAMNLENAAKVVEAGAVRINSNSYLFHASDLGKAVESLKKLTGGIRNPV